MKRSLCTMVAGSLILASSFAFAAPQKESSLAAPHPSAMEKTELSAGPPPLSGKVVETMSAGGYTYVCIEKNGTKTWVAVPEMKVVVGKEMSFLPGQAMPNFTSKSLNRTFDMIVFSGGPASADQAGGMPAGHGAMPGSGSKSAATADLKNIKVGKAAGPNAYTVGEIFAKRSSLHKKAVVVKGKVVKVSSGIMGRNWVHVQDGSGDPKKSTHNLVVTSNDLPSVGDVVTVKGTVFKDKDFGSGYKYDVIVEQATVQP